MPKNTQYTTRQLRDIKYVSWLAKRSEMGIKKIISTIGNKNATR